MLIFQKYLAWVQRYFYQIAGGELPPASLVLSIDHDWPLETFLIRPADYVTIAGSVNPTIYAPGPDRHGLVFLGMLIPNGADMPATDTMSVILFEPTSVGSVTIYQQTGFLFPNSFSIPLIGNTHVNATRQIVGAVPQYVGPNQQLQIAHSSAAGGVTFRPRLWVVERPAYYPLRLP